MKRKLAIGALSIVLLAGCGRPPVVVHPTGAQTQPAGAPAPSPQTIQACPAVQDAPISLQTVSSGTILQSNPVALLDIGTRRLYALPSRPAPGVDRYRDQVSPDGSLFAYLQIDQNSLFQILNTRLWVVDARGRRLADFPFARNIVQSPRWLDDRRLLLYTDRTYQDGSVLLVDPFSHEQRLIAGGLPGFAAGAVPAGLTWRAEYSPDLEWVAYLALPARPGSTDKPGTVVRDLPGGQTVWTQTPGGSGGKPVWSPDGLEVAIPDGGLSLVGHSGQIRSILDGGRPGQVQAPVWSPDGSRIAFWNAGRLMVYDLQDGPLRDMCIAANPATPIPPAWSPDGRQLVVYGQPGSATGGDAFPILLDLQKALVYTHVQGLSGLNPAVWLTTAPQ